MSHNLDLSINLACNLLASLRSPEKVGYNTLRMLRLVPLEPSLFRQAFSINLN